MKGTLCFWDRTGNSFDEWWVLVKKKEREKNVIKRDIKVFEPFSSQQLIGAAASFKDLSSRGIQHESLNCVVFFDSSRSGDALVISGMDTALLLARQLSVDGRAGLRAPPVRCTQVAGSENTSNGHGNAGVSKLLCAWRGCQDALEDTFNGHGKSGFFEHSIENHNGDGELPL